MTTAQFATGLFVDDRDEHAALLLARPGAHLDRVGGREPVLDVQRLPDLAGRVAVVAGVEARLREDAGQLEEDVLVVLERGVALGAVDRVPLPLELDGRRRRPGDRAV